MYSPKQGTSMAHITYLEAIWQAIREEMRRNPGVLVLGQDVQFDVDTGALQEFGAERVRNTPISEAAFIGAGIGAALTGMRPIVELGCSTFLYSAMDQIVNQAAKSRYMFGGQASVPLLIRAPVLYGISAAAHHADRPWGLFAQAPGLKIIIPSTPHDAKGLLKAAIRDSNPVLCFEDANLAGLTGDVPDDDYIVQIGTADVKRVGSDVTIVALAASVHHSLEAARRLDDHGISAEVIDVRTVVPLDRVTIVDSVRRTGRLIVVDPAPRTCSVASEVSATVAEEAFGHLRCPIVRLTAPDVPVPFSPELERLMYPTVEGIISAAREQLSYRSSRRYERGSKLIQTHSDVM
jgi:acetoin:2,6-dichlorophenolindophenol oxidoreductase subunit beta